MAENPQAEPDLKMEADGLYREEVFTDRQVGTIQRLVPVDAVGNPDASRAELFVGQAQLMTRAGPLPLSFEIAAGSLREAADKFGDAAKAAVEEAMQRLEEMRREAASSIIVPDGTAGPLGGQAGGGSIRMP